MDAKKLKLMYKYCPHCQKQCSIKAYKDHKRLFFNSETNSWVTVAALTATHGGESDSTSLSSEDDTNDEHLLSFEPTASDHEMGGTTISDTVDIAGDTDHRVDGPSEIDKGTFHLAIYMYMYIVLGLLHV